MKRLPIVGYVIAHRGSGHGAMEWFEWPDGTASLVNGDNATLFHTRRQARRAIQKSLRLAQAAGLSWAEDFERGASIFAVRPGEPSRWKARRGR